MKKVLLSIAFLLAWCGTSSAQGVISCSGSYASVVACLAPGQWGDVTGMSGWQNYLGGGQTILDMYPTGTLGTILGYMGKGAWNCQTHELFIYGGPHGVSDPPYTKGFAKFNADTGLWSRLPLSPDTPSTTTGQHFYDYNTIDCVNQDFYVYELFSISAGEPRAMKYHIPTGVWTTLPHNFPLNSGQSDHLESMEYFPDIDRLTYTVAGSNVLGGTTAVGFLSWFNKSNPTYGPYWSYTNGSPTDPTSPTLAHAYNLGTGLGYPISHYDPVHHLVIFGGGSPDFTNSPPLVTASRQLYAIDISGNVTALPLAPIDLISDTTLSAIDPVMGDIQLWFQPLSVYLSAEIHYYTYHQGDSAWVDHGINTTAAFLFNAAYATSDPIINRPLFAEVTASDPDNGVILITKHNSTTEIHEYLFKYAQRPTLSQKCAVSGTLNCWNFNSRTNYDSKGKNFTYHWDTNNNALNSDPLLAGYTSLPSTGWRNTGEAIFTAFNMFATPTPTVNSIPQIDTSVKWEGAGSLLIPMSQYSIEETGSMYENLDGNLGHPNVAICNNITTCPQGNTIWAQAMVHFTSSMINDYVFECSLQLSNTCYNAGGMHDHGVHTTTFDCDGCTNAGYLQSFCLALNNPGDCRGTHVGKRVFIYGGTNCIPAIYTITAVNAYNQIVLNQSPSAIGTICSGATVLVENLGGGTQGWKLLLLVSNALPVGSPPNNSPTGNCECIGEVGTRGNQTFPAAYQVYDTKGLNSPAAPQLNYLFVPYTWYELTERVIVGNFNPSTGYTDARVTWWIDGNLAYDWTGAQLDLSGGDQGYGLGQIQLETYTTKRDAFYPGSDPAGGLTNWDNVITSTNAIPFNKDAGGAVTPCSSPSKVVFTAQPHDALLNGSLGTVVGQIQDSGGVLCTTATNSVALSPHSGATWATLTSGSSLTKSASGGVVSWNDLTISPTAGAGSIDAASSGLTGATSNSINITNNTSCSSPSKVVITVQPSDAQLGKSLGTITAQIQDSSNVLCNTATNSVTLSKHSGATWGTLTSASSLTQSAVAGTVSWSDLSVITTTGSGAIDIASSGLTGTTTNSINISVVVPGGGSIIRRRGSPPELHY